MYALPKVKPSEVSTVNSNSLSAAKATSVSASVHTPNASAGASAHKNKRSAAVKPDFRVNESFFPCATSVLIAYLVIDGRVYSPDYADSTLPQFNSLKNAFYYNFTINNIKRRRSERLSFPTAATDIRK